MINFFTLYGDKNRSKYPLKIKTSTGITYMYSCSNKLYEKVEKINEADDRFIVNFEVKGKNVLHNIYDVSSYETIIRRDIVFGCLGLDHLNRDFSQLRQLILFMANKSFGNNINAGDNIDVIDCIDQASAGGVLIAKEGTYEGKYSCFDINNSYNAFFCDYNIPTNPRFKTVDKIINKKPFALYKLKIDKKYWTKEINMKFKTKRKWFTKFDIDIFDMFDIEYELIIEDENCIIYDSVNCNFDWMEKLNKLKQKTDKTKEPIKYNILKTLLSSFWGQISKFNAITIKDYGKEISDEFYFKCREGTGDRLYKNPDSIFKYSCGIIKPFVLAYARLRLLKQIKKIEDNGYEVVYSHTDSIITNSKLKYFDIGTDIGQFKLEKEGGGITIKNIASKIWE